MVTNKNRLIIIIVKLDNGYKGTHPYFLYYLDILEILQNSGCQ